MFAKTALLVFAVVAVASAAPKPGFLSAYSAPFGATPFAYSAPLAYTAPAVAAPLAYTAPAVAAPLAYTAPIAPVASSSQVIARNYNGVAAAYYAPAATYVF